ncbi:MAG: mobile mystery protein A [Micrococcales bacterium]
MAKSVFTQQTLQARISLDAKLPALRSAAKILAKPRGGWIQTVRTSLGMSAADLAHRLQVTPSTIHRLEKSEIAGTINLESLEKAADELGCEVVYALIPRQAIEEIVNQRALKLARQKLNATQLTMGLEKQALQLDVLNKLVEQKAAEIAQSRELWKVEA